MSYRLAKIAAYLLACIAIVSCGGQSDGDVAGSDTGAVVSADARRAYRPPPATVITTQAGTFQESTLSSAVVGVAGGVLSVTNPADPLFGAQITVPPNTLGANVTISLSSAPVSSASGLPQGASIRGRLIRLSALDAQSNPVGSLENLVRVTLPYEPTTDHVDYYRVEAGGTLEPVGFHAIDRTASTISFRTREPGGSTAATVPAGLQAGPVEKDIGANAVFVTYVAIGLLQQTFAEMLNTERSVDTGFVPSRNGWFIPNYGSYYKDSRGGNCFGMVAFSKWYYRQGYSTNLVDNYRDPQRTPSWRDDAVAIELASRMHNQHDQKAIWQDEGTHDPVSSTDVARSIVGALYVTRAPAVIVIWQLAGGAYTGGHAISFHRVDLKADGSMTFHVYDPNKPSNDAVRVNWAPTTGFANYLSGTDAASSSFTYNYFRHNGYHAGLSQAEMVRGKSDADSGFPASVFPKVTITRMIGNTLRDDLLLRPGTTPAPASQPKFTTADDTVLIEGTVLGGNAQVAGQVVDKVQIFTPVGNLIVSVNNRAGGGDGKFGVIVPLKSGINQIAMVAMSSAPTATNPNGWKWAGYSEVFVESTAAPSSFTVTMAWNRGTSDVDLYVREPGGVADTPTAGKTGDIVYYSHRAGVSTTNPYLDLDNTSGYGPEHYIARQGMVTKFSDGSLAPTLNGTYRVGVHYYGWSGAFDAPDKTIGWTASWRYLGACLSPCADPEVDGLWVTGSRSGSIAAPNSGQQGASGFNAGGSAWSSRWDIDYPTPQMIFTVPPSHTVMLP
jgi:hypothetical protein